MMRICTRIHGETRAVSRDDLPTVGDAIRKRLSSKWCRQPVHGAANGEKLMHQLKAQSIPLIEHFGATKLTAKGLPIFTAKAVGTFASVALQDSMDYLKRRMTVSKNIESYTSIKKDSHVPRGLTHQVMSSVYQTTWKVPQFDWEEIVHNVASQNDEIDYIKDLMRKERNGVHMDPFEPQTHIFRLLKGSL